MHEFIIFICMAGIIIHDVMLLCTNISILCIIHVFKRIATVAPIEKKKNRKDSAMTTIAIYN